ncbi:MAG TPA: hypothetical protein VER58_07410 [Thermoanaerobaculia bacterium]|nr:hypothetical protein [Thermoanaerobaculia bacterium]
MLAAILFSLSINLVPFNDLGPTEYAYGYFGGLYENGSNAIPPDHLAAGLRRAELITPRNGKIVFLSVGFGETEQIFNAFTAMTGNDPRIDRQVVFVNGAREGADSEQWIPPMSAANLNRIRDTLLRPAGLSEDQVQVAWVQMVTNTPYHPLPPADADAYRLKGAIAYALFTLKLRYPNLQIAYLSSRIYGGYATTPWNPEPYAYESALSNRWVILGQVTLMRTGFLWDTRIGDVNYQTGKVPWVAWGPYFWANGTLPRSDGLTWQRDDFASDGEHISPKGAQKAANLLLQFLLSEPTASWFRVTASRRRTVRSAFASDSSD